MKAVNHNPYRIAGLLSNSSEREITKQKSKISKFASVGREIKSEYDFTFLKSVNRSAENVDKAFSAIEQSQGKVSHSLFWFLKVNSFDETALNHLSEGNKEKAEEIWNKVTQGKEITVKNFSCFNNLGSILLSSEDKNQIQKGIELKIKLIESNLFKDFVLSVADQTFSINNKKQVEIFVDEVLANLNDTLNTDDTQKLFKNCGNNTNKYLASKFTDGPIQEIESKIQSTKKKRNETKEQLYEIGYQLFKDCLGSLMALKGLLGKTDLKYKMIADNLAKEVMQCGIDYFNEFKDTKDPSEKSLKLIELAKSIALGQSTVERIDDNYEAIKEWAEGGEANSDIEYIANEIKNYSGKSIYSANTLLDNCISRLNNLKESIGSDDDVYIQICSAISNVCMNTIIEDLNKRGTEAGQGYGKGNMSQGINDKIQLITNYKSALKKSITLMGKLANLKLSTESRQYLQENRKVIVKNELAYRNVTGYESILLNSTSKSRSSGGCYIATMAYGDYDHPQVLELRRFRDEVLLKNYFGKLFVKIYYAVSPHLVKKLKNQNKINKLITSLLDRMIEKIK